MSNGSSITVEITGGPSISVPWFAGMNAQQALEGAFNQGTGIDSTILNAGDVVGFNFEMYVPEKHEQSLLRFKHEFQTGASARDIDKT